MTEERVVHKVRPGELIRKVMRGPIHPALMALPDIEMVRVIKAPPNMAFQARKARLARKARKV